MAESTTNAGALHKLPEELLNHIITFLPWQDLVAIHLTNRALNRIAKESLIWRRCCVDEYRYWQGEGYLQSLLSAAPASLNWKQLFANRKKQDRAIDDDIESILASSMKRVNTMHHTILTRYDAKDNLLRHLNVPDGAEDVLSRRYWVGEMLGSIERAEALDEWFKLAAGQEPVPLERALGAFDLFIAERPPLSLDDVSRHLDHITTKFKVDAGYELFESSSTRDKARMLSEWLRTRNYTGLDDDDPGTFRDVRNILIGVALCEKNHPSLPLISVAIFCCVAQRLGLDAQPCPYPAKVLAMIMVPETYPAGSNGGDPIYLDPHGGSTSFSVGRLKTQLSAWGIPSNHHDEFLQPASTISMVKRVARNMTESLREQPNYADVLIEADNDALSLQKSSSLSTSLHPARGSYAICWIALIFQESASPTALDLRIPLTQVASHIQHNHRQDLFLLHMITPKYPRLVEPASIGEIADSILVEDDSPPLVHRRSDLPQTEQDKVEYRVGQVMKHARFAYIGVITGWDTDCRMGNAWISQMGVDRLPGGRNQPFYHVVVADDESVRYVAHENVIVEKFDAPPPGLRKIAGKYFKRWDSQTHCFVSNVQDQYPED